MTARRSTWDIQLRLRDAAVLLVGLGGTGSLAAHSLVASGVGWLHCVDHDVVELSNLNRQMLYTEADIGRPKVDVAVARLRALNSDVTVTGQRSQVRGPGDLANLVAAPAGGADTGPARYDLLVLCADHPDDIRRWANRVCLDTATPWVDGGYRGPEISVGMYRPGVGPCWECLHRAREEAFDLRLPPGVDVTQVVPKPPVNPVNAVSAGLSGILLAHVALASLTGAPPIEPGIQFGMNLVLPGEPVLERYPRREDCPACGCPR